MNYIMTLFLNIVMIFWLFCSCKYAFTGNYTVFIYFIFTSNSVIQQFIFYFRNKVAFFAFDVENNNRPTLLDTGILYGQLYML